jgi:hypothetical protein
MKWGWSRSDAKTWRFNAWYVVWAGKWLHEDYGSDALAIAAAEAKMIDWKF